MFTSGVSRSRFKECCLFFIFFLFSVYIYSSNDSIRSNLNELDKYIPQREIYEKAKIQKINKIKDQLNPDLSNEELYNLYNRLYDEYQAYSYDSAYYYAQQMLQIAKRISPSKELDSKLLMAYCCISAGLFLESNEIINTIDSTKLNAGQKIFMYSIYAKLNLDMANSLSIEPYYSHYNQESIKFNKAVINLLGKDNPDALPHEANIYRCQHNYKKAIEVLNNYLDIKKLDERSKTLCAGALGQFYLLMGDTTNAVSYLSYTAISDIKAVTKETPGLSLLAGVMYKNGDIKRAYDYAHVAFEDANFYNAQHRKMEVGNVLPIIESSRYKIIQKQKDSLFIYSILVSVLIGLFFVSTIVIWKKVKQLRAARKVIKQQNRELRETNKNLSESNIIKEEYIGHFFRLNSIFINEMESFKKLVSRKVISKQYDDLTQLIKKADFKKEQENKLISFDNIILKLFPDFVEQFNQLFDEKYRIVLHAQEPLTPEMRIFALIRLGINDSEDIAKFLNYSINTINTYKTKVKNRSKVPNELFEQKIKEIQSIK